MILPPIQADGLGVAILNSNAETHFSFTNALGMVSVGSPAGFRRRSTDFRVRIGSSRCIII